MAVNRGLVGLVAVAVLVWGVAFGGGLTLAVLTSNATVTTTFETVGEFAPIEASPDGDLGTSALSVENGSTTTVPVDNSTENSVNANASAHETVSVPPGNETSSNSGNVSDSGNETALPETESGPDNETVPSETESGPDDELAPDDEPKTDDELAPTGDEPTFKRNVPDPAEKGSETTGSDAAAFAPTGV
ncbi:hypothetical protein DJ73_04085 [Halorubrum sp. Ea1]|uniref:hypothetical protein n=1 Tax=Halorubrum sp. Ea1 TaxID=1480718 RepID=UPI000B99457C|nr:hypothetical protein [Halorubrum sp. Ea1]OYR54683.1 hypothetical protein DJ73_04085 [Halorubrum sp. Ea1]